MSTIIIIIEEEEKEAPACNGRGFELFRAERDLYITCHTCGSQFVYRRFNQNRHDWKTSLLPAHRTDGTKTGINPEDGNLPKLLAQVVMK